MFETPVIDDLMAMSHPDALKEIADRYQQSMPKPDEDLPDLEHLWRYRVVQHDYLTFKQSIHSEGEINWTDPKLRLEAYQALIIAYTEREAMLEWG